MKKVYKAHIIYTKSRDGFEVLENGYIAVEDGRMARKDDELRLKNRVIVDEVERRHRVIDRAVKLGVNRAALL